MFAPVRPIFGKYISACPGSCNLRPLFRLHYTAISTAPFCYEVTQYGHSKNHSAVRETHCVPRLGPTLKMSGPLTGSSGPRLAPWPDNGIVGTGSANNRADATVVATDGTNDGATKPIVYIEDQIVLPKGL